MNSDIQPYMSQIISKLTSDLGWITAVFTALLAPAISEKLKRWSSKPKVTLALLSAEKISENFRGWTVRIAVKNQGDREDTFETAYLFPDDSIDKHLFAVSKHYSDLTKKIERWAFNSPKSIAPQSIELVDLYFLAIDHDTPNRILFSFLSGKRIEIKIREGTIEYAMFETNEIAQWMRLAQASKMDPNDVARPRWHG